MTEKTLKEANSRETNLVGIIVEVSVAIFMEMTIFGDYNRTIIKLKN